MTDDELRDILGASLYAELESLTSDCDLSAELGVDSETLARLSERMFHIVLPLPGDVIVHLASKLRHAASDCEACSDSIAQFVGVLIGTLWSAMMRIDREVNDE